MYRYLCSGNTKGGSFTLPLASCLTGLESPVWQLTIFVFICKTDSSKPVKQEVNSTVILLPLVFPAVFQQKNLYLERRWRMMLAFCENLLLKDIYSAHIKDIFAQTDEPVQMGSLMFEPENIYYLKLGGYR